MRQTTRCPVVIFCLAQLLIFATNSMADDPWIVFEGGPGMGAGKHIVLISGDEEYRSEEALPMLAMILSDRFGFRCTVLFAINKETGEIDPNTTDNIPGLKALETADLMFVFTRFRVLPDEQMKYVDAYLQTGKPIIGIRPSVVAFRNNPASKHAKYSSNYRGKDYHSGFGRQVLGATWISHHGRHGQESTLGIPEQQMKDHPIMSGVDTMWGPTDVYTVRSPIPHDGKVLVMGQVLKGMNADAPPSAKVQMPLAWVKHFPTPGGKARVFMSTMGDAQDFLDTNFRRMVINGCFWAVGLEDKIPERTNVKTIVSFNPSPFGFNKFRKGLFPRDYAQTKSDARQADFLLKKGDHICYIGNTLADRMQHFGWLEALVQSRLPEHQLVFRNLGFAADELTIRPRSMNFGTPHSHLTHSQADVVFAFFGYNESFAGEAGLSRFRSDLKQYINETRSQKYNGTTPPRLVLFSPIAHENLHDPNLPDGSDNNLRLSMYTAAIADVARDEGVTFVDLYTPTLKMYTGATKPLTINGIHLNDQGNQRVAEIIEKALFGDAADRDETYLEKLRTAIREKNLRWFNRYRATDGYSSYGQRAYLEFVDGQTNKEVMDQEMLILDAMTSNRDARIWAVAQGRDVKVDDSNIPRPLLVKTNIGGGSKSSNAAKEGSLTYLGGEEAIGKMTVAEGMEVGLFASEEQFPELVNPVQMAVDTDGRMWVAAWHTYPHWDPLKELNDKLLIFPDDDGDGKADRCIVFADGLHNPTGFEFWNGGVLVANAPDILFLKDTDGDDKADVRIRYLHGIDSADTHCNANSFVLGPDGCIYFSEGIFHYTNIETPWGKPLRTKAPMLYRWNPRTGRIANHFHLKPNPHGIAIDAWGNLFATDGTTGQGFYVGYPGKGTPHQLYPKRVRPVAGLGLMSGTHFPESNRGNLLICNTIGFLGILQHKFITEGADIRSEEVEPIVVSSDGNFRPVDVEIGADGALYFLDWHNAIIGHMQHNLRDPSRDHAHGRVYRVTNTSRSLLKPEKMKGKPIEQLLGFLESAEDTVRYRARIELSGRDSNRVLAAAAKWANSFDSNNRDHAHHLLEALWLHEQHNAIDESLLKRVLESPHPRARAAAVRVLGHWGDRVGDGLALLRQAARDPEGIVRAEAVVAAASFEGLRAAEVVFIAQSRPLDDQLKYSITQTQTVLDKYWQQALKEGKTLSPEGQTFVLQHASGKDLVLLPRTEKVCRVLLTRDAIPQQDRADALIRLAEFTGQTKAEILLDQITRQTQERSATLSNLAGLLCTLPAPELKNVEKRLVAIVGQDGDSGLREAAIAALIETGNLPQTVFEMAAIDQRGVLAYLNSVPLVPDAYRRSAMYDSIQQLLLKTPEHPKPAEIEIVDAVVRALKHVPNHDAEIFSDLATLIKNGSAQSATTIEVLRGIPQEYWPVDKVRPLAENLVAYLRTIVPRKRNAAPAVAVFDLASRLASALPAESAAAIRKQLDALAVQVIEIGTVPHRMIYDKQRIAVQAGRLVEFRFSNSDQMPHNLAIVEPGTLEEVGLLAEATGSEHDAAKRHYIPKSDKVLISSTLLHSGKNQTLFFKVPTEIGVYSFVCTYPGHWRRMNGAMYVVDDLKAYEADPSTYVDKYPLPVRDELLKYIGRDTEWKLADLAPFVQSISHHRSFDVGESVFKAANCVACHQMHGQGIQFGPDLMKLDTKKFTPEQILRTMIEPSSEINEDFQAHSFLLFSGKVVSGLIVKETDTIVKIIVDPRAKTEPVTIDKNDIEDRYKSGVSTMPEGLLNKLTREEILDLIAYVFSKGDKSHELFQTKHQH